jgi:predicted dehydrogenase
MTSKILFQTQTSSGRGKMKKIKWLLAGAGDIAKSRVAPALCAAAGSELSAVCGRSPGRADALAAETGAKKVFYDYGRALSEADADAVYIAAPNHLHIDMALKALAAGKHFFCEKPLGLSGAECVKLFRAAQSSDRVCGCSNYRLLTNQFETTRRMIQSGAIGGLLGGWAHDEESYYNPGGAPLRRELGMCPSLMFGFYLINLSQALLGDPSEVFAMMSSLNRGGGTDYDIDDLLSVLLRYPGGGQFSIILNMTADAPLRHSCQFYGSKGRIYWPECPPHFNSPVWLAAWPEGLKEIPGSHSGEVRGERPNWHLPMIEDFIRAVQTGGQPVCSLERAVKTALITDAAVRSASSGKSETINYGEML